jgi:hypothetical protein
MVIAVIVAIAISDCTTPMQPRFAEMSRAMRRDAHQRKRKHGLAGARFADNAERFALRQRERDVIHRAHPAAWRGKFDNQSANVKAAGHGNIITVAECRGRKMLYHLHMIAPPCPHCHSATLLAANTPYCPHCGWNRDSAIGKTRSSLMTLPIAAVMSAGFLFFMIHFRRFRNSYEIAILVCVPIIGILVNYVVMKRSLKKLEALRVATVLTNPPATDTTDGGPTSTTAFKSDGPFEPSVQDQVLLKISPPREIRMATRGRISIGVMTVVFLSVATILGVHLYGDWARTHSFAAFATKDWGMIVGVVILLLFTFATWRSQARECELLENGQVAMGKVVRQWEDRGNSSINYEFSDYQGHTHSGSGFDYTKKLFQGMPVPVFYDRDNSKRNVAYCATLHEIAI